MRTLGVLASVLLAVAACSSSGRDSGFADGTAGGPGSSGSSGSNIGGTSGSGSTGPTEECTKMDLVFIVDDSGSMSEEQTNLASNFPAFIKVLDDFRTKSGSKIDYRVAVTTTGRDVTYTVSIPGFPVTIPPTTEKGDNGAFRNNAKCAPKRRWIERADDKVAETFSCIAQVGTSGPGYEMPLESLKLALNDRMKDGTNAGFLREDALLAIIILTDEDDCSRTDNNFSVGTADSCEAGPTVQPVGAYKSMLDTVAKGAGRWAAGVIAGPGPGECSSSFGKAVEAKRLKDFVAAVGKNGTFSSICDGNLGTGLKKALDTFDGACRSLPPPNVK